MKIEEAKTLRYGSHLIHKTKRNKSGNLLTVKVNGIPKTWKTRPNAIRIPAKYGLYEYFQIGCGLTDKPVDSPIEDWDISRY